MSSTPPAGRRGSTLVVLEDLDVVLDPEPDRVPDSDLVPEAEPVSSESDSVAEESSFDAVLEADARPVDESSLLFVELVLSSLLLLLFCRLTKAFSSSGDHHHVAETVENSSRKAKTVLIRPEARILTERAYRRSSW